MNFIDFFVGIGCFSFALEKAGFERVGYSEIVESECEAYEI